MEQILHQFIPIIYKVLYIPGGDRQISSINSSEDQVLLFE